MASEITPDEKRADQLTAAPEATEEDAAPRITVSKTEDGMTRIDIAGSAAVRLGESDE